MKMSEVQKWLHKQGKYILLFFLLFFVMNAVLLMSEAYSGEIEDLQTILHATGAKWSAGETSMTQLSPEERRKRLGAHEPQEDIPTSEQAIHEFSASVPTSLDWRSCAGKNWVTTVKNQGSCGSCWAFGTTAGVESAILRTTSSPDVNFDLSEQVVLSCSGGGDCTGGYASTASDFLRDTGTPVESCYPYTATNGSCANACSSWGTATYKIDSWKYTSSSLTTPSVLKTALYDYGPIVAWMKVYNDLYSYRGGIYSHKTGIFEGNHFVLIVGYDDAEQYFIVKNSWGTDWGQDETMPGYFRIAYSELTSVVEFGHWTYAFTKAGAITGSSCSAVTQYTLTVPKTGTGTVSATGCTLSWSGNTGTCTASAGTSITLSGAADAGSTFTGWIGGGCSGTGNCQITLNAATTVNAFFRSNTGGFTDIPIGYWAQNYIEAIYAKNITTGCESNAYCPATAVTNEQMAAFIVRAVEGEPASTYCNSGSPFADVPSTTWSCKYIKRVNELGIMTGCGKGTFCPGSSVLRWEMAKYMVTVKEGANIPDYCSSGSSFSDVLKTDSYCRYTERLKQLGITNGCQTGLYCPLDTVNRDTMSAFLSRTFLGLGLL